MRELFWGCVAALLSRCPGLVNRMILSAFNRPHRLQLGDYMGRWWLLPRGWLPFALRIHHIRRADLGFDPHNHPGTFRTIILKGHYIEVRGDKFFVRNTGDTALTRKNDFHRIAFVPEGGVITLVIEWGYWKGGRWGFMVNGEYVDHDDYHGNR